MDDEDVIFQGDVFKLSESKKRLVGSKSDTWKPRYLIIRKKEDKPVLEYHRKKPKSSKKYEKTLTESFELWPTYKVEKLQDARGRSFVCEVTSPEFHLFLSGNTEKEVDIMVFLLQVQIRLKANITENLINVLPVDSDTLKKIGAKGKCSLHASPWGLTLVLKQTRALLAQWPLKSIRYYETSGSGTFNIEAGRVAPMGEGLFSFKTKPGEDDFIYDLIDNFIVDTLDRVKPTQKGTPEEIADYIREHDCLHSLTTVSVCSRRTPEIQNVLKAVWNIGSYSSEGSASLISGQSGRSGGRRESSGSSSNSNSLERGQAVVSSSSSSRLVINLERPELDRTSLASNRTVSSSGGGMREEPVSDRPPPLPARAPKHNGVPRRSRRRDHSLPRKADVMAKMATGATAEVPSLASMGEKLTDTQQVPASPRRHSNPSDSLHRVNHDDGLLTPPISHAQISPRYQNAPDQSHTQFHQLSGQQNMKVRVSKSPVVTRNPNKVGRAEYLINQPNSGLRSPTTGRSSETWTLDPSHLRENDRLDEQAYMDAVARASRQKYGGGHNSIDRRWAKLQREVSSDSQDVVSLSSRTGSVSSPSTPVPYRPSRTYVNIAVPEVSHERQRSADGVMGGGGGTNMLPPPVSPPLVIRHGRQRSADEFSRSSFGSIDPRNAAAFSQSTDMHHSRQNSVTSTSACSTLSRGRGDKKEGGAAPRISYTSQVSQASSKDGVAAPVVDWLMSASCEDLSDHMRTAIYDGETQSKEEDQGNTYEEIDTSKTEEVNRQEVTSPSLGSAVEDKPPLPFTGLKKFHDNTDSAYARDRSKSFGYVNIPSPSSPPTPHKPASTAPSAHLIRKMVNARAKQDTLRKSLSNPNFLNLGSKEHLYNLKSTATTSNNGNKLAVGSKQKSRSIGSLFPAIKKAFSRESLGHSRSTTPERRASFSHKRRSSEGESSSFQRQNSCHSLGEITIKGIRLTERSRSFRRVRGAKSVEVLARTNDGERSEDNRHSTGTSVSVHSAVSQSSRDTHLSAPGDVRSSSADTSGSGTSAQTAAPSTPEGSTISPPVSPRKSSSSRKKPSSGASNPGYMSTTYISLTSSDLPPLPSVDKSKVTPSSATTTTPSRTSSSSSSQSPSLSITTSSTGSKSPSVLTRTPSHTPEHDQIDENSNKCNNKGKVNQSNHHQHDGDSPSEPNCLPMQSGASPDKSNSPKKKRPHVSDLVAKIEGCKGDTDPSLSTSCNQVSNVSYQSSSSLSSSSSSSSATVKPFQPMPFKKHESKSRPFFRSMKSNNSESSA
ncbi:serine-rich adhesin for platelets [Aplysia californica]|uniref:Serine-rich adhesin for platelets n=1 Tax=Aplysia californica TaxID=6500 RepID=A0ABM0J9X8_APLCA|nr:serine-rich adhesin for platelets [Aplysia californica]